MVPQVFVEIFHIPLKGEPELVWNKINKIGGDSGWYFGTVLWKVRGLVDLLIGGVGYRKGRENKARLVQGHQVDFWRVVAVDEKMMWTKLKAEMLLPGEVCLEWEVGHKVLHQKLEFKPFGWYGRYYWYLVKPLHHLIFKQMAKKIARG
jgi:hypothetical protein